MFKSKRSASSASKLASEEFVSRNVSNVHEDDFNPSTESKKKKKNFFYVLRSKINSVLEGKGKNSPEKLFGDSITLRSKSFEVLSNSFEDTGSPDKVQVEDLGLDKSKKGSKRSQSVRSKQTVCPADYGASQSASNSTRTGFQSNDIGLDGIISSPSGEKEVDAKANVPLNVNNLRYPSNIIGPNNEPVDNNRPSILPDRLDCNDSKEAAATKNENTNKNIQTQMPSNLPQCKEINTVTLNDLKLNSLYLGKDDSECRSLTKGIGELSKHGWYWGPLSRNEAEQMLLDQPDGAFLVRDSSDVKYLLSLSFRSYGNTLHTRIEHSNGWFSFYPQPDHDSHRSLVDLINHCMSESDGGVFCYSRPLIKGSPSFPVRLTKPVSRFMQVRSLQYLCRFVIRRNISIHLIQTLPLPPKIKAYLNESYY